LECEPQIINILKSESLHLMMRKKCIAFASYDNSDNTLLIGINDDKGPTEIARYWTVFKLPKFPNEQGKEINIEWNSVHDLNPEFYPKTYYNHQYPALEWINIMDMTKTDGLKYCYTTGGKLTRMKSGPEYEFSILSKIDTLDQIVKNLEVEKGKCSFSANQKFFLVRPKSKKRLVVYNLKDMELAYEIPLKAQNNLGKIEGNTLVAADIFEDRLYIYSLDSLNICQIIT